MKRLSRPRVRGASGPEYEVLPPVQPAPEKILKSEFTDAQRRLFFKGMAAVVFGLVATSAFPRSAKALVMGGTPSTGVVGVKNSSNARINPATEDSLLLLRQGNPVLKKTITLTGSGAVHTPAGGKKIRVYNNKFSLDASVSSVSFRFTSGGTDHEIYLAPRTGGLYGTNNHPNYVEGGVNEALYCAISGSANVQINIDYLEV